MVKKIIVAVALVSIIGVLVFGAVNRSLAKVNSESSSLNQIGYRSTNTDPNGSQIEAIYNPSQGLETGDSNELINLPPASEDELSESEVAGLLYMREEEKLAHDVYVAFYTQYGTQNFQNISQSELTHTEAVKTLIDRYGLTDLASSETGVFTDPDLQALYDELISRGSQSLVEALKVGAAIEEIDILDLKERLAQTDNADIQLVYENLIKGSENHLRTFVAKLLQQTGETYVPQYLSLEEYQTIINTETQVGGNNLGVGGGNGGYRGG